MIEKAKTLARYTETLMVGPHWSVFDQNNLEWLISEVEKLKLENAALKEGKAIYRHFKGNEYTVICECVHDEAIGPHALPDTVYVGKDGIKYRRPTRDFHGLKDGIKRFERIPDHQPL